MKFSRSVVLILGAWLFFLGGYAAAALLLPHCLLDAARAWLCFVASGRIGGHLRGAATASPGAESFPRRYSFLSARRAMDGSRCAGSSRAEDARDSSLRIPRLAPPRHSLALRVHLFG